MKHLLFWIAFLLCQGCTTLNKVPMSFDSSSGAYNPITVDGVDSEKYRFDKQQCFKQVEAETESSMMEQFNIIKFRDCLVKKGYVLMSVAPRLPYQIAGPLTQHIVRPERLTPAYI